MRISWNSTQENGIDSADKADLFADYYYREMYYDSINPVEFHSRNMCDNGHYALSNLNDTFLTGWEVFDGIRSESNPRDIDPNAPIAPSYFIPLPENAFPGFDYTIEGCRFNVNSTNNGEYDQVLPFDQRRYLNFNSIELYEGRNDEKIPGLISTQTPHGNRALRINNAYYNYHINKARKAFVVDSCDQFLTYSYAMVMENPTNHDEDEQPFFGAYLYNIDGTLLDQRVYIADTSNSCYEVYSDSYPPIVYRDWTCDFFDLRNYQNDSVYVEFIASDCGRGGHFGYGYVGDLCDTCCTPELTFDFKADCAIGGYSLTPKVRCESSNADNCIGDLPYHISNINIIIYGEDNDTTLYEGIAYHDTLNSINVTDYLLDFEEEDITFQISMYDTLNCGVDTLFSEIIDPYDSEYVTEGVINPILTSFMCIYGRDYDPSAAVFSGLRFPIPEGYEVCDEETALSIEGVTVHLNPAWTTYWEYSRLYEFGGMIYASRGSKIFTGHLSGTIDLCHTSTGNICTFTFDEQFNNGSMCPSPGVMCFGFQYSGANNPGFNFGYPQYYNDNFYFRKKIALPFVLKIAPLPDEGNLILCEIEKYTVKVELGFEFDTLRLIPFYIYNNSFLKNQDSSYNDIDTQFPNIDFHFNAMELYYIFMNYNTPSNRVGFHYSIINGCEDTCTFFIPLVLPPPTIGSPDPPQSLKTNASALQQGVLTLYPNPAHSQLNILSQSEGLIIIRNLQGAVIQKLNIGEGQLSRLDINSYRTGLYLIQYISKDGIHHFQKFIKH